MSKPLILIVEDDDATAECLTDLLRAEGYETQTLSVPGSLETVRRARPDLILLDLVFPESRGEDLLSILRRDRELRDLPVVLLSAVPHLADAAARLPVQGFVSKPFELDHLLGTVGGLIQPACLPESQAGLRWTPADLAPNS